MIGVGAQHAEKFARTELGLAILSATATPGRSYSQAEIAAYAGCSRQKIAQIEERALGKLRKRLLLTGDPALREFMEEATARAVA